ncbi:NmrA family NAD(P)-binding protein [Nocardia brasiliensis]|uniref:NmrA family NAD(P)-binding protein n=1 Tax=Nocardia brasiliensis TaxID=37326 RepID=UPI003D775941
MRITVFGATGDVGSRVVAEALTRGHEVLAVVREPAKGGGAAPRGAGGGGGGGPRGDRG